MTIELWPGEGILGGIHDTDEIERSRAEDHELEYLHLLEAKLETERARIASEVEQELLQVIHAELVEELAARKLSPEARMAQRTDFGEFRTFCTDLALASLPAHPAIVAAFLARKAIEGASLERLEQLAEAISAAHRRYIGNSDPVNDPLVCATLRYARRKPDDDGGGSAPLPTDPAAGEPPTQAATA